MALKPRLNKNNHTNRNFYGREYFLDKAVNIYNNLESNSYNVIMYYGMAGIGKSSLIKSIKTKYEQNESNIISYVNFEESSNIVEFYSQLISTIGSKIDLFYFNIAFTIYWSKINPNITIKESNFNFLDEGSFLSDSLAMVDGLSAFGLGGGILSLAVKYSKKIKKNFKNNYQEELEKFEKSSVSEMEEALPKFFSYDIKNHLLKQKNAKFLFLLDTHEVLWEKIKQDSMVLESDVWLRDLILFLENTNSLFIIAGREKLRWIEEDDEWNEILNQYKLTEFDYNESIEYLRTSGIKEDDILNLIAESSEGIPFYLNLSLDTYFNIEEPKLEHFINNKKNLTSVFNRFLFYSNQSDVATLKVLAATEQFDFELFSSLVKEFNTGLPITEFKNLTRYSFISTKDDKNFYIHNLMKQSIIEVLDKEILNKVYSYLYRNFNDKVQLNIISKLSNSNTLKLFFSALHYYSYISSEKEHLNYFNQIIIYFYKLDQYKYILYAYNKELEYLNDFENILKIKILLLKSYLKTLNMNKLNEGIQELKEYDLSESFHNELSIIIALKQKIIYPNNCRKVFEDIINHRRYNNSMDLMFLKINFLEIISNDPSIKQKQKVRKTLNILNEISKIIIDIKLPDYIYNLDSLYTINNLIDYYIQIGRYNLKLNIVTLSCFGGLVDYLKQALYLAKKYYNENNLYIANIYEIYADDYLEININKSEDYYYKVLEIYDSILGSNSKQSSSICKKIAQIKYYKKDSNYTQLSDNILLYMILLSLNKNDKETFINISKLLELRHANNVNKLSNISKFKILGMINNGNNYEEEIKKLLQLTFEDELLHQNSYAFISKCYLKINNNEKALIFLKKQRDLLIKLKIFDNSYFDNFKNLIRLIPKQDELFIISETEKHLENVKYKLLIEIYKYLTYYYSNSLYLNKAIEVAKKHKNYSILSTLYLKQSEFDAENELKYLLYNKNLFEETNNYIKLDTAYGYLVDYYKKVEDKIQVEEYLIAQLNLRKNYIKNDNKLYKGYFFLYLFYLDQNDLNNQIYYLEKLFDIGFHRGSQKIINNLLKYTFTTIECLTKSTFLDKEEFLKKLIKCLYDYIGDKNSYDEKFANRVYKIFLKLIQLNNNENRYKESLSYTINSIFLFNKINDEKKLKTIYFNLTSLLNDIYIYSKDKDLNLYFECLCLLDSSILNNQSLQIIYKKSITNFRLENRIDLREIMQSKLYSLLETSENSNLNTP